jgi:branched-subunit amino acid transport protein AzlD
MKKKLSFAILALLIFFCFASAAFSDDSNGVAHVWGPVSTEDYFVVGVAAGLLCAMIAMIPISQRWLKTRRGTR